MVVTIFIKINGKVDSQELYAKVSPFGMNVTDLIDFTLVYADCDINAALLVIDECSKYGDISIDITHKKG